MRALFFAHMNPKTRDEKVVNEKLIELNGRLDQLEKMLADSGFATGADFTLADCAGAPRMFFRGEPARDVWRQASPRRTAQGCGMVGATWSRGRR